MNEIKDFKDKTVLITGAGSGIGRETAFAFAKLGAQLILCDIDEPGCQRTATLCGDLGSRAESHRVDVGSEAEMTAFAARVHAQIGAVDVLVNNAGVGVAGSFMDTDLATWQWIIDVNLKGVIHGCHLFGKRMVERNEGGHIVNVSSAAGYTPAGMMSAYCTTKYGVLGLSECLRADLFKNGIGVSVICPGIINTPITRNTRMVGHENPEAAQRAASRAYARRNFGPDRVARAIVDAVRENRGMVPVSPEAWFSYYLKRFLPSASALIARRLEVPQ